MPWTASEATQHTSHANTPRLKKLWAATANSVLKESGDDAKAIRIANAAVNKEKRKKKTSDIEEKSNKVIRDLKNITDRF